MKVAFRADAGPRIGTGHVMRLLTLANALVADAPDTSCVFLCRHLPDALERRLLSDGHEVVRLGTPEAPPPAPGQGQYGGWLGTTEAHDATATLDALATLPEGADRVVVDHYGLGSEWERIVRAGTDVPLWALDDLTRLHSCSGLIDTTYGREADDYSAHVPEDAVVLAGARFALLRPDFAELRDAALARRDGGAPFRDLLVSMGGMDADNATARVLDAVAAYADTGARDFGVHVMLGASAPHLEDIRSRAGKQLRDAGLSVTVHAGVEDVASLLARMDGCVGAPGSSTWERACLGLPTVNVTIADNQQTIARNLAEAGAVRDGGTLEAFDAEAFAEHHLRPLVEDVSLRRTLSLNSREIVDGRGAGRVARELALRLVPATREHIETMFAWQTDPVTRAQSRNPEPPRWDTHLAWSERRLRAPYGRFYIVDVAGEPSGVVRLEPRGSGPDWEISVLVAPGAHGRGIGTAAIRRILARHPRDTVHAFVKSTNPASQRAFEKSGFARVDAENFVRSARSAS